MRALTIRQPWATFLAVGVKAMETRSFNTKVRGPVALHAGAGWPCRVGEWLQVGPYWVERDKSGLLLREDSLSLPYRMPMGSVLAIGDLFATSSTTNPEHCPDDVERSLGDHSPGRFAWSFTSISRLPEPIPAKGMLGFWNWEMPAGLNEQLRYPIPAVVPTVRR